MRATDIQALFDFTYWADRQLLAAAEAVGTEAFTRPVTITYRNLRDTLVHTLDVEASWRRRLRGEPKSSWDVSLMPESYSTVADLASDWARDEADMRTWLASLTDADLGAIQDLGDGDRYPLWYYLVHIVTHSEQQRRDVQIVAPAPWPRAARPRVPLLRGQPAHGRRTLIRVGRRTEPADQHRRDRAAQQPERQIADRVAVRGGRLRRVLDERHVLGDLPEDRGRRRPADREPDPGPSTPAAQPEEHGHARGVEETS